MGEYLQLVTSEWLRAKGGEQNINFKEVDRRLKLLINSYNPQLTTKLFINRGEISAKIGTCETCFFTLNEMRLINRIAHDWKKYIIYGPQHEYNAKPINYLKDRSSHYKIPDDNKKAVIVTLKDKQNVEHSEIWKRTHKVTSKNGKTYYKKYRGTETSGVANNLNGRLFPCPNKTKEIFKALIVAEGFDFKTSKTRNIYNCLKCRTPFNMGEKWSESAAKLTEEIKQQEEQNKQEALRDVTM